MNPATCYAGGRCSRRRPSSSCRPGPTTSACLVAALRGPARRPRAVRHRHQQAPALRQRDPAQEAAWPRRASLPERIARMPRGRSCGAAGWLDVGAKVDVGALKQPHFSDPGRGYALPSSARRPASSLYHGPSGRAERGPRGDARQPRRPASRGRGVFGAEPGFSSWRVPRKMRADASQDSEASSLYGSTRGRTRPWPSSTSTRETTRRRKGSVPGSPSSDATVAPRASEVVRAQTRRGRSSMECDRRPRPDRLRAASSAATRDTCPWSSSTPASATAALTRVRERLVPLASRTETQRRVASSRPTCRAVARAISSGRPRATSTWPPARRRGAQRAVRSARVSPSRARPARRRFPIRSAVPRPPRRLGGYSFERPDGVQGRRRLTLRVMKPPLYMRIPFPMSSRLQAFTTLE